MGPICLIWPHEPPHGVLPYHFPFILSLFFHLQPGPTSFLFCGIYSLPFSLLQVAPTPSPYLLLSLCLLSPTAIPLFLFLSFLSFPPDTCSTSLFAIPSPTRFRLSLRLSVALTPLTPTRRLCRTLVWPRAYPPWPLYDPPISPSLSDSLSLNFTLLSLSSLLLFLHLVSENFPPFFTHLPSFDFFHWFRKSGTDSSNSGPSCVCTRAIG